MLRFAIIGAGKMASRWAKAFKQENNCRVVAVADKNLGQAELLAAQFPGSIALDDADQAMRRSDICAVLIATPHHFLAPLAISALRSGKHVLSEKPGGVKAAEIAMASKIAKRKKLAYMVGFNHRYHEAFLLARKFFEQGKIGDIMFIRSRYGFGGRAGLGKEWRLRKSLAGGGELIDQGVHMIDMCRSFLGEIKTVYGFAENLFWGGDVEDNGFALIKSKTGAVASIHVSWTNWKPIHEFEIFGTKGYLLVQGLGRKYGGAEKLIWGERNAKDPDHPVEKEYVCNPDADASLVKELEEFISAIKEKRQPVPSGMDAVETLKIVERVYQNND